MHSTASTCGSCLLFPKVTDDRERTQSAACGCTDEYIAATHAPALTLLLALVHVAFDTVHSLESDDIDDSTLCASQNMQSLELEFC